jgi:hypothetical protein
MAPEKKLSREYTPQEVAEETKGVDESLPEEAAIHRRPLSGRVAGGAEHRAGAEEEAEEAPHEERPKPSLPPRGVKPSEGR